jgi:hypothetical protein
VIAIGLMIDLGPRPLHVPGPRRQVNEQWLHRYRGWVYGVGFGAQLGVGIATIVSTSAVYATLGAAVLAGSIGWGAAIGATFGAVRGLSILPARRIRRPDDLVMLDAGLRRWDRRAGLVAGGSMACLALISALGALT